VSFKKKKPMAPKSYLLWLLSKRDYPKRTLVSKLKARGLELSEINNLIEELIETGIYNEESFKKVRVRSLLKKGHSPGITRMKLKSQGCETLNEEIQQGYLDISSSEAEELKKLAAKLLLRQKAPGTPDKEHLDKLIRRLQSKGHSYSKSRTALEEVIQLQLLNPEL
jgi:SOS response regulatory protein OraA/RecX